MGVAAAWSVYVEALGSNRAEITVILSFSTLILQGGRDKGVGITLLSQIYPFAQGKR
jgi:hypothetical protein